MRTPLLFCLILASALLWACTTHPEYKAAALSPDAGFIGAWRSAPEEGENRMDVAISARTLGVGSNGRINGYLSDSGQPKAETYLIKVEELTKENERSTMELFGYLIAAGDVKVLGVEPADSQLARSEFVLPVHYVVRYQRDADRVTLTFPKAQIIWMPLVRPVDSPPDARRDITLEQLKAEGDGMLLAHDIDRLVELYTRYAPDPEMWDAEHTIVLERVPAPPTP